PDYDAGVRDEAYWEECAQPPVSCKAVYVRPPYAPDIAVIRVKEKIVLPTLGEGGEFRPADVQYDSFGGDLRNTPSSFYSVGYGCEAGFGAGDPTKFRQKWAMMKGAGLEATQGIHALASDQEDLPVTYYLTLGARRDPDAAS